MLRLHTFGSVYLVDDSGRAMAAAAGQRRTVGLLSALAVAGHAGLSRDKIVGLLWPDSEAERARHSLTQTLYLARKALRCDDLFDVGADVRLNPAFIASDVGDFQAALEAGDFETAIGLYRGPFLDGFFLPGSTDFEQWATTQRSRLEDLAIRALDRMAVAAGEAGDHRGCLELHKRVAALRPLDSTAALNLMRAFAAVGDRAGALQYAHLHETLLRDQLELSPDPRVSALVSELREVAPAPFAIAHKDAEIAEPVSTIQPIHDLVLAGDKAGPRTPAELSLSTRGATRDPLVWVPRRSTRRRVAELAVAALALVGFGVLLGRGRDSTPEIQALRVRQQVVVAPFRVAGASSSLEYLREGLVELLSTRLADDSTASSVDAGAVLGAWRMAGLTGRVDVPRDTVVSMATRLGAERVVIGSVVGTSARAVVSATVVSVPAGTVHGEATVEGPADSIASLVDQLAARLLTSQAGEDVRLADRTTSSLSALHAYLRGQSAYRKASYPAALRSYGRALELDSTFALAALRLAIAADRANDVELQRRALAAAWRFRDGLDGRELAHLTALTGPRYPNASTAAEQLSSWEHVVSLAPDRAEAWYGLGTRLFRDGATLGLRDAHARASSAFQRALTIDASFYLARQFLIQLSLQRSAPVELADLASESALQDSLGPLAPFLKWRVALARQDSALLRSMQDTLIQLGPVNLRTIAMASQFDAVGLSDGARAIEMLLRRATRLSERIDAILALHSLALNQGKPLAALEATARLAEVEPLGRTHLRLRVLDALYADGDSTAAVQAVRELERLVESDRVASSSGVDTQMTDLCVLAQWRLARADTVGLRNAISLLRAPGAIETNTYLSVSPSVCGELLDAGLAVKTRGRSAHRQILRVDSLALGAAVAGDASHYAHLFIARLYQELGEPRLALDANRRRSYMTGWPRYLATAWREEGLLAESAGDPDGALQAYERFLLLRAFAEPSLQPQIEEIRLRATRLAAKRTPSVLDSVNSRW